MEERRWHVLWDDFNWERWAADCGCEFLKLEPREAGGFWLHLRGTPEALGCFANDMGQQPEASL